MTALFIALPPTLARRPFWGEITRHGVTIHTLSRVPRISKQERAFMRSKARRRKYHVYPRRRRRHQW